MAVSFVNAAASNYSASVTSATLSFVATGCDFLVVWVQGFKSGAAPSGFSATYNGVSMTAVSGSPWGPDGTFSEDYVAAFYLANPATGANTVSVSWSNALAQVIVCAQGFLGAGLISGVQSSTTGANLTVTSTVNSIVVGVASSVNNGSGQTLTATSGTLDWNKVIGSPTNVAHGGGHAPGASSVAFTWSSTRDLTVAFSVDPSGNKTATTSVGSYSISGVSPLLKASRHLNSNVGSYSISGVGPSINRAVHLISSVGSYSITGVSPAMYKLKVLVAAVGSYAIAGVSPLLKRSANLIAAVGSYSISGVSPLLKRSARLISSVGSYAISGVSPQVVRVVRLNSAVGSYTITGSIPLLKTLRHLYTSAGNYVYTGIIITAYRGRRLNTAVGAYVVSGLPPLLLYYPVASGKFLIRNSKAVLTAIRKSKAALTATRSGLPKLTE